MHGRLGAEPGERDELRDILTGNDRSETMPGCRLDVISVDETDPDGVWATEIRESEAAHQASLRLDAVRERISRAMPLIDTAGIRRQRLDARAGIPRVDPHRDPPGTNLPRHP
ncbi:antibiotic biosynthesis monooxygenase family protein [Streptomyces sp. NPDC005573]|uniref:antibiotic biosynthesis monooxygenase family protein n=1 Tax=Streptomyces sp. NPDC005573 TaxID=3156890 RepID=UPI0033B0BAA4